MGAKADLLLFDAADQSMVNSIVTAHGITLGGEGCCSGTPVAYPVNSGVVGNLATQPHTVTDWTPTLPGLIAGMAASSVFAHDPQAPMGVAAAAWNRSSTVGGGRLVVLMDINWAEADWRAASWSDVAENVAFFLSGLSAPPAPVLVTAPFSATLPLQAHAGTASRSTGSGATSATR